MYTEDNNVSEPEPIAPKEEEPFGQLSTKPYTQLDRNVVSVLALHKHESTFSSVSGSSVVIPHPWCLQDILNHILNDIEIIMGQIGAALAKKASKKKKKKGGNLKEIKAWSIFFF